MPMRQGREWTYLVPQASSTMTVKAISQVRVGTGSGWLLSAEGGSSRLMWQGGKLLASELGAMKFDPPLALLQPDTPRNAWEWKGTAASRMKSFKTAIRAAQEPEKLKISGVQRDTLAVTLQFRIGDDDIEMKTWFERGSGILAQEQRNNGELASSLTLLSSK